MEETIENRARLMKLTVKKWTARKYDDSISQDVAQKTTTSRYDVGRFNKVLIPEWVNGLYTSYGKLEAAIRAVRAAHREHTVPWDNGEAGYRLLPGEKFLEHAEAMREAMSAYETARDEFFADYPKLVAEAQQQLGPLFNKHDYPEQASWDTSKRWGIYGAYSITMTTKAVPQTDFRTKLTQAELDDLERTTQARIDAAVKEALKDVQPVVKDSPQDLILDSMKGLYGVPDSSDH